MHSPHNGQPRFQERGDTSIVRQVPQENSQTNLQPPQQEGDISLLGGKRIGAPDLHRFFQQIPAE